MLVVMHSLIHRVLVMIFLFSIGPFLKADDRVLRVALLNDKGVEAAGAEIVTKQLREAGMEVVQVKGEEIAGGILSKDFDVVVFTAGSGTGQGNALGEQGRENVRAFVREGGGYLGICAGAYLACSSFNWGVGVLNAKTVSPKWQRGHGIVEMEVTAAGEELSGLAATIHDVRYQNGPIIMPHGRDDIEPYETVAYFRTELAENDTPEGIMINSPAIARGSFGKGRVVISSPHPESTDGMEGAFAPTAVHWAAGSKKVAVSSAAVLSVQ